MLLPPAAVTVTPLAKKHRDLVQGVLALLATHQIASRATLAAYLLAATKAKEKGVDMKTKQGAGGEDSEWAGNVADVPLLGQLQLLFRPEHRQEFRAFWKAHLKEIMAAATC